MVLPWVRKHFEKKHIRNEAPLAKPNASLDLYEPVSHLSTPVSGRSNSANISAATPV